MRYRPRPSVTTILAKRVGRSVVSAMTQAPASGPFELETTPPISSGSRATAAVADCPALVTIGASVQTKAAHAGKTSAIAEIRKGERRFVKDIIEAPVRHYINRCERESERPRSTRI